MPFYRVAGSAMPRGPGPWSSYRARSTAELVGIIQQEAAEYVDCVDRGVQGYMEDLEDKRDLWWHVRAFLAKYGCLPTQPTIADVFDVKGADAALLKRESERRAFTEERSAQADDILRAFTIHHNGAYADPGTKIPVDAKTRFQNHAREFKLPTAEEVEAIMPKDSSPANTHPMLAAERYLTVTNMRAVPEKCGAKQFDPCISSNGRDKLAYGPRPINTIKDYGHEGRECPKDKEWPEGTKVVHTKIDCLNYASSLADSAGHDMIIWASYYPELAGRTEESVYYADSASTYVEIIGDNDVVASYEQQTPWDFTANDVVYIENVDRTAFTVYNRVRYVQAHLLKQVVFLSALHTINLPYHIANKLVKYTKGHDIGSIGMSTPGPCKNVHLVPRDPTRGWTKDILVMRNGTHFRPTVAIKYVDAIGPDSAIHMDVTVYDFLKTLHNSSGRGLTVHEAIKRIDLFAKEAEKMNVPSSAAYVELLRTVAWWGQLPNVVYYLGTPKQREDPCSGCLPGEDEVPEEHKDAKAVMTAPNIVADSNPGVVVKTDGAMEAYKKTKFLGMANKVKPSKEWVKISNLILRGFIKGIARESGIEKNSVSLIDVEHIRANRTRPAQRARQVTDGLGPSAPELGRVENKVEAAHKTGDCCRGVQNPEHGISENSAVLGKTLEIVLKACPSWYDPGKSPEELAEAVYEVYCTSCDAESNHGGGGLRSVDYTGADEGHNEHSNRVVRALIEYFICLKDMDEALGVYDSCFHMWMQVGAKILSTLWKNASGTGITTVLNTVVFALRELETTIMSLVMGSMTEAGELVPEDGEYEITYKMFLKHLRRVQRWDLFEAAAPVRRDHKILPGTPLVEVAYHWIGPKFGDDGLAPATPRVPSDLWERAMKYVDRMDGFKRKLETCSAEKGEPVEYLSRIYPCLARTKSSFCKVEKALAKLSLGVNRNRYKFIAKLRGYFYTDRHAPIVGAFIEAVCNLYNTVPYQFSEAEVEALKHTNPEVYYKVALGPYPWDGEDSLEESYAAVAEDYGMTSGELIEFDAGLRRLRTWKEIQEYMVPKKKMTLAAERLARIVGSMEDPLALVDKPDPPGVYRVAAAVGEDPRLYNESLPKEEDPGSDTESDIPLDVRSRRTAAALSALALSPDQDDESAPTTSES